MTTVFASKRCDGLMLRGSVCGGRWTATLILWTASAAAASLGSAHAQTPAPAERVLINGKIITVDARDSIAQAVAIAGGKIVAVGTNEQIKPRIGKSTEVIDLEGRTATPGLIDAHVHFIAPLPSIVDLSGSEIKRLDDVLSRVRKRVGEVKEGEWVIGRGWDEGKLAERRYVAATDLDAVSPKNPVWLTHTTGHYGVANSYALKLAGITKDMKDPPAGTIDRDAQGRPSGVLKEEAMKLVEKISSARTPEQQRVERAEQKAMILKMIGQFNAEGMTGAKDPGISAEKWALYQEILSDGRLNVRVFALFDIDGTLEGARRILAILKANRHAPDSLGDGRLLSGGVKVYIDGSGGARTAWMSKDWSKDYKGVDSGNKGYPATEPELYRKIIAEFHDAGYHIGTHAIGDRGIDWVVDTYEAVLKAKPTRGLRHSIIHANLPTDHANEVMARLQREYDAGYPEPSPSFMWWIGDTYAGNLGPGRAPHLEPLKTWRDKGIKWASGSDFYVTPFAARYGIWASIARQTLNGRYGAKPFGTAESVDIKSALRSYTIWAAHQIFLEDRVGSIEVGKDADIAVWDRDFYTVPPDAIKDAKCELTLLAGRVVYRKSQ